MLGVVPITAFWNLRLPTKTKVGVCFLMGCTLFAAVCSVIKTYHLKSLKSKGNFTYDTVGLVTWAM